MLSFFFRFTYFFSQSQPLFFHFHIFFHLIMLSFFFSIWHIFFLSLNFIIQQLFFSLCSNYALKYLSFLFSVFFISVKGRTLWDFSFFNFFQLQHQLFQMNYDHSFYYYYIDEKYQYLLFV